MDGAGGDATLTPEYPGITDAADVDLVGSAVSRRSRRVRKKDEDYWDTWRAAPKAFIPLDVGQRSVAEPVRHVVVAAHQRRRRLAAGRLRSTTRLSPCATCAARRLRPPIGTTDFGEYFRLLQLLPRGRRHCCSPGMFFALGVEQRARELGLLLAVGFREARRAPRLLAGEGAGARLHRRGTRRCRRRRLRRAHHVRAAHVVGRRRGHHRARAARRSACCSRSALPARCSRRWSRSRSSLRRLRRAVGARIADSAGCLDPCSLGARRLARQRTPRVLAFGAAALAALLVARGAGRYRATVAAFFGAGGLLLIAGCAAFAAGCDGRARSVGGAHALFAFGAAYARWRPTRSVLSAALIAFACFVIVAVARVSSRSRGNVARAGSGTGGFVLMAESVAPLMHNPNTATGREELSLAGFDALDDARISRFGCGRATRRAVSRSTGPRNPRIIAPEAAFPRRRPLHLRAVAGRHRRRARQSVAAAERRFDDGAVPAIADQTSLTYVFHLGVGDDFVFTPDGGAPGPPAHRRHTGRQRAAVGADHRRARRSRVSFPRTRATASG